MADRLTQITTKTGDDGTTGIVGGERVAKDSLRIEAIGTLDELNSVIGVAISALNSAGEDAEQNTESHTHLVGRLIAIQHDLFDFGGELAMPGTHLLSNTHHERLDQWTQDLNTNLPPLKNFILPGGSPPVAQLQLARAVSRRAERRAVSLQNAEDAALAGTIYLNRLSDFLFVAARWLCQANGEAEYLWQQNIHAATKAD